MQAFTEDIPFSGLLDMEVILEVAVHGKHPERPAGQAAGVRGLSDDVWNVMKLCWTRQPALRPKIGLVHDIFSNIADQQEDDRCGISAIGSPEYVQNPVSRLGFVLL